MLVATKTKSKRAAPEPDVSVKTEAAGGEEPEEAKEPAAEKESWNDFATEYLGEFVADWRAAGNAKGRAPIHERIKQGLDGNKERYGPHSLAGIANKMMNITKRANADAKKKQKAAM